jgi:hypothetical protein
MTNEGNLLDRELQLFVVHQELGLEIIRMMMSSKTRRRRRILGWLAADLNHDDDDE